MIKLSNNLIAYLITTFLFISFIISPVHSTTEILVKREPAINKTNTHTRTQTTATAADVTASQSKQATEVSHDNEESKTQTTDELTETISAVKKEIKTFGPTLTKEQLDNFRVKVMKPIIGIKLSSGMTRKKIITDNFTAEEQSLIKTFLISFNNDSSENASASTTASASVAVTNEKSQNDSTDIIDKIDEICAKVLSHERVIGALNEVVREIIRDTINNKSATQTETVKSPVESVSINTSATKPFAENPISQTILFDREYIDLMQELYPESAGLLERNDRMRWDSMIPGDGGMYTFVNPHYIKIKDGVPIKIPFSKRSNLDSVARYLGFPSAEKPGKDDLGKKHWYMVRDIDTMIINSDKDRLLLEDHRGTWTVLKIRCKMHTLEQLKAIKKKREQEKQEQARLAAEARVRAEEKARADAEVLRLRKIEQERVEQERIARERIEQERLAQEREEERKQEAKLAKERGESKRIEREKEARELPASEQAALEKIAQDKESQAKLVEDMSTRQQEMMKKMAAEQINTGDNITQQEVQKQFVKLMTINRIPIEMNKLNNIYSINQLEIFKMLLNAKYSPIDIADIAILYSNAHRKAMKALTDGKYQINYSQVRALTTDQQAYMLGMMVAAGYNSGKKGTLDFSGLASLSSITYQNIYKDAIKLLTQAKYKINFDQINNLYDDRQIKMLGMMLNATYNTSTDPNSKELNLNGLECLHTDVHLKAMKVLADANYTIEYSKIKNLRTEQQVNMLRMMVAQKYQQWQPRYINLDDLKNLISDTPLYNEIYEKAVKVLTDKKYLFRPEQIQSLYNQNQIDMLKMMVDAGYGASTNSLNFMHLNFDDLKHLHTDIHKQAIKAFSDAKYIFLLSQVKNITTSHQVEMLKHLMNNGYTDVANQKNLDLSAITSHLSTEVHLAAIKALATSRKPLFPTIVTNIYSMNQVKALEALIANGYLSDGPSAKNALEWIVSLGSISDSQVAGVQELSASKNPLPPAETIKLF